MAEGQRGVPSRSSAKLQLLRHCLHLSGLRSYLDERSAARNGVATSAGRRRTRTTVRAGHSDGPPRAAVNNATMAHRKVVGDGEHPRG